MPRGREPAKGDNRIPRAKTKSARAAALSPAQQLLGFAGKILDDGQAEAPVIIDLQGKSSIADYLLIATGRSARQVAALAEHLVSGLKDAGYGSASIEGLKHGDWVLIDAGDVIVHLFRPEARSYYNLEKLWSGQLDEAATHSF
jgi:ribosome-associated protein